jgi:iron complex transport system substrate-binding protein
MLGQADKIVAVPDGVKRDALLNMLYPSIGKALVPVASGYINIEELLRARPDMAFIRKETGINSAEVAKLDKFKIPYLVVDFQSIKQQQDAIEIVGKALGVENKAREYNEYYQDCINRVQKLVNTIPYNQRPRVYHAVNEATRTDTRDSLPAEWTQIAGAVNVSVDQPLRLVEGKNFASLEQILLWNPDIILTNEPGVGAYIWITRMGCIKSCAE